MKSEFGDIKTAQINLFFLHRARDEYLKVKLALVRVEWGYLCWP